MILFNITYCVEKDIESQWLAWVKTIYVSEIQQTKLVSEHKILKLLTELDNGGVTFSFQCWFKNLEDCEKYQSQFFDDIQYRHYQAFKGKFVEFSTLLEMV